MVCNAYAYAFAYAYAYVYAYVYAYAYACAYAYAFACAYAYAHASVAVCPCDDTIREARLSVQRLANSLGKWERTLLFQVSIKMAKDNKDLLESYERFLLVLIKNYSSLESILLKESFDSMITNMN